MSQYKFKRKSTTAETEPKSRIMNANASPEENTAVFTKTSISSSSAASHTSDIFVPLEEDEDENKSVKHTKVEKSDKGSVSVFGNFIRHKKDCDEDIIDTDEADIISKAEDIINGNDMSVDEIKENLGKGKKVNLAEVFTKKKNEPNPDIDEEDDMDVFGEGFSPEAHEVDYEEDTYDGAEEASPDNIDEDDIYVEDGDVNVDIPVPIKPKKQKKVKETLEYNSFQEREDITDRYRKKEHISLFALIVSLISTLALVYLETRSLPHPEWMMPGKYGFLYLMFDLQLVFVSGVCVFSAIKDGAIALFTWKPNKNSVTFVTLSVSILQILLHLIFNTYSKNILLYSSVFSICASVTTFVTYIDARREHIVFKIASSSKVKTTITELDESSTEYNKFGEYLPENSSMYKITKTSFVSDHFRTNSRPSIYNDHYRISIPLVFTASVIFAVLSHALSNNSTLCDAINSFSLAFMMGLPISSLFTVSLPFYITSLRLSRARSAIIGEASIEEFASAPLVSFHDTDIFNPKGVTIASIKTYGKTRIDNTYLYTAKVFKLVGGPLNEVFDRSVINIEKNDADNSILSVTENGINAMIDSNNVLVGNQTYMIDSGLDPIDDESDRKDTKKTNMKVLYVAVNGEISAKFYIKYVLGTKFKKLLDSFCNLGICIAVNTRDPNIDTDFLLRILKDKNYPIVAVKNTNIPEAKDCEPCEKASGGIVSLSSVYDVLRTFIAADKLSHIISINTLTKYISLIFAFTLIVVAFLTGGSHEKITPLFIMLYQLVWSLPVIGTSIFS